MSPQREMLHGHTSNSASHRNNSASILGFLYRRYQDFGDKLQVENVKLNDELETQKLNLRDINEFLTNELKARSLTTSAMEAKVVELYHLLDDVNKSHEVRLQQCVACRLSWL